MLLKKGTINISCIKPSSSPDLYSGVHSLLRRRKKENEGENERETIRVFPEFHHSRFRHRLYLSSTILVLYKTKVFPFVTKFSRFTCPNVWNDSYTPWVELSSSIFILDNHKSTYIWVTFGYIVTPIFFHWNSRKLFLNLGPSFPCHYDGKRHD